MSEDNGVPPIGWAETTFGDIFDFKGGSQPPKKEFVDEPRDGYVRLLQIRDFASDKFPVYIKDADRWPKCSEDDVMIARYGASLGRVLTGMAGAYNVALIKMIFDRENIHTEWARYFLMSNHFQGPINLLSRSAQNGFNKKEVSPIHVQLPPLAEQRRIVGKIEALQERSRNAREALAEVGPLLEQFRQSLLAAAFRGDLTADWRAANPNVEPATELLARIRQERREKWEQSELAKYEAKGKQPPQGWQDKYKEPEPVDDSDLPELPDGWCWTSFETLAAIDGGLTRHQKKRSAADEVVPLISVGAVQHGYIDPTQVSEIGLLPGDGDKATLEIGDLLIVEGNGSLEHIGRAALWDGSIENVRHQNHLIRVRPDLIESAYALHWLASPRGREYLINEATSASGLYNLSLSKVGRVRIPLAPSNEQSLIVRLVDEVRESLREAARTVAELESDLATLDQSILAKAFRGELVPQDPNDEPASVLLERIRQQRGDFLATKNTKSTRKKM